MKLYLSSYLIPDPKAFADFVGKDLSSIKVGLVSNAKDYKSPSDRLESVQKVLGYFSALCQVEEIDLLKYPRGENLLDKFKEFDVIWLVGGNTYSLRWAIEQSSGKDVLKQALESGVIYGGDSAGAIIAGPTLKHFEKADDPTQAPEALYDGLGFVDVVVLPHWDSEAFHEIFVVAKEKLNAENYKTIELPDSGYVLVEDDKVIVVQ